MSNLNLQLVFDHQGWNQTDTQNKGKLCTKSQKSVSETRAFFQIPNNPQSMFTIGLLKTEMGIKNLHQDQKKLCITTEL